MIYRMAKNGRANINASIMTILSRMLCVSKRLRLNGKTVIPNPSYEYVIDVASDRIIFELK